MLLEIEKKVSAEDLETLTSFLSCRDSLIAYLLYLGPPSLDDVLSLRISQIKPDQNKVEYSSCMTIIPSLLMKLIAENFMESKNKKDFVFLNRAGEKVNRSRIYKAFIIACEKAKLKKKITPLDLMETKIKKYDSCGSIIFKCRPMYKSRL